MSSYCLDVPEFARQYSGGHATVVYGCYGVSQAAYKANAAKFEKELNKYSYDISKAKELLVEDGWTLNEKGEDYIYEAKLLIVGEAGAGKTTLAMKIKNSEW